MIIALSEYTSYSILVKLLCVAVIFSNCGIVSGDGWWYQVGREGVGLCRCLLILYFLVHNSALMLAVIAAVSESQRHIRTGAL